MRFEKMEELNTFVNQVNIYLNDRNNQSQVNYSPVSINPWNSDALLKENKSLLDAVAGKANLYAIFCADGGSEDYILLYIGKTTRKLSRQRIINHLIKKHEKTGAKLSKVMEHVAKGGKIKISWVKIEPESLRNCVEEELILKHPEAIWNRENGLKANAETGHKRHCLKNYT